MRNYHMTTMICFLPKLIQEQIKEDLLAKGIRGNALVVAMTGCLSDLEDKIDLDPYRAQIVNDFKDIVTGDFAIGDPSYFGKYDHLIFKKKLDHKFSVQAFEEDGYVTAVIQLYKSKKPLMNYYSSEESFDYPRTASLVNVMKLGCDCAAFEMCLNNQNVEVKTLSDGYFGEVFKLDGIEEYLIHLSVTTDAISATNLKQVIEAILTSN